MASDPPVPPGGHSAERLARALGLRAGARYDVTLMRGTSLDRDQVVGRLARVVILDGQVLGLVVDDELAGGATLIPWHAVATVVTASTAHPGL